ncbi:MAG: hypothetical protein WCF35_06210, partial [Pseudolabrys sp.]
GSRFADGKTAKIEYRWANGQYDQLRKLAEEALHPATIAAAGQEEIGRSMGQHPPGAKLQEAPGQAVTAAVLRCGRQGTRPCECWNYGRVTCVAFSNRREEHRKCRYCSIFRSSSGWA